MDFPKLVLTKFLNTFLKNIYCKSDEKASLSFILLLFSIKALLQCDPLNCENEMII